MDVFVCPPDHKHDATSTCRNQHGCHCEPCADAKREYNYWLRHMLKAGRKSSTMTDATGVRRRLQALAALGWSSRTIAEMVGTVDSHIREWQRAERVSISTAAKVCAVYDRLSMKIPQATTRRERQCVSRARNDAARRGWVPPLAWDDDTIDNPDAIPQVDVPVELDRLDWAVVDAAVLGDRPAMSPVERAEAITRLNARNWSAPRIAEWVGCNAKTVDRVRARLGLPVPDREAIRDAA